MQFPVPDVRRSRRRLSRVAVIAATAALLITPMPTSAAGISHYWSPSPNQYGWLAYDSVQVQLRVDVDGFPSSPDDGDYYELLKSVECGGTGVSGGFDFDGTYRTTDTIVYVSIDGPGIKGYGCTATYVVGVYDGCSSLFGCPTPTNVYETTRSYGGFVWLDRTPPFGITGVPSSQPNAAGWYRTPGTVDFYGSDSTSGVRVCSQDVPFGGTSSPFNLFAPGNCTDYAGNTGFGGFGYKYDDVAPTLAPSVSPSVVPLGGAATATANATDTHSRVKSQGCDPVDTSTPGVHTVSCTATDNADNTATGTATYSVGYVFSGFADPVDPAAMNVAKAGRAIPLKWRATDASGAPVTDLQGVTVTAGSLSCAAGTTEDQIEEYAIGSSGLQNLGDGYYQFNWSTPKSYAGSCKIVRLDLGDGIVRTADFEFTK